MNSSKKANHRFWQRWRNAGAVGGMPTAEAAEQKAELRQARKCLKLFRSGDGTVYYKLFEHMCAAQATPEDIGTTMDELHRRLERYYEQKIRNIPSEGKWRNDLHPKDSPTVSTIVMHAEDVITTEDGYTLTIKHVTSFHGKGFMPSLSHAGNGDVSLGTDETAHAKAVEEGRTWLARRIRELNEEMVRLERLRPKNPPVTVEEVTVDRDRLLTTASPNPIDLGGRHNFNAALSEMAIDSITRATRGLGGRVFLLTWEGNKVPRGAQIFGHIIVWTQHGQVTAEIAGQPGVTDQIGSYDRLEEFGGPTGKGQKMLVYLSPHFHPPIVTNSQNIQHP